MGGFGPKEYQGAAVNHIAYIVEKKVNGRSQALFSPFHHYSLSFSSCS